MPADIYDVIVIGGGVAATHAAYPLVRAGLRVAMLDGGLSAPPSREPTGDFEDIRRKDDAQHELFLGRELSDIAPIGGSHARSMVSGGRAHVSARTDELLPVAGKAQILQSLAKGGFSESWGAVCALYDQNELRSVGIPPGDMRAHYRAIIERIGVSGEAPDYSVQPPAIGDSHARAMADAYRRLSDQDRARFKIERPLLAVLTEPLGTRRPISYRDLEFALNDGHAIYRARFTIEELEQKENFSYRAGCIVERVVKEAPLYAVLGHSFEGAAMRWEARRVVIAAGALNTTRIALASFDLRGLAVPFILKTNVLIPCLSYRSIGQAGDRRRHSLCQLVIEDNLKTAGVSASFTHLYSYKSLLLFQLARYLPLPLPETLSLLSLWAPSLVIADVRFPEFADTERGSATYDGAKMIVHANAALAVEQRDTLSTIKRLLRRLGQLPMRTVLPPVGASAHYAGGIPFVDGTEHFPLQVLENGALTRDNGIYIADAASWRSLPPKPPTLTIMANANRIGQVVARDLGVPA